MWRILCVEDSSDSLELLSFVLKNANENLIVEGAQSAAEAIRLISAQPFDLYVLDRRMPGMDGAELCQWIRRSGSGSPVIFYTGAVRDVDRAQAFEAGANEYLIKPNDLFRLGGAVKRLLGSAPPLDVKRPATVLTHRPV